MTQNDKIPMKRDHQEVSEVTTLMAQAIEKGTPVETMERLLAMRRELKAEYAKSQYDKDMADFQSDCPIIVKTKEVKTKSGAVAYRYAPIESIVEQVKPYLKKYNFSYSTQTVMGDGKVKAICIVKHIDGHNESYEMEVPLGNKTEIMSNSQVVAAATTFAKRYAFCNAFGILTGDDDTDAQDIKPKVAVVNKSAVTGIVVPEKKLPSVTASSMAPIKTCPHCGKEHTGRYPKCIDCWKSERELGKKLPLAPRTKTLINPDAEPF